METSMGGGVVGVGLLEDVGVGVLVDVEVGVLVDVKVGVSVGVEVGVLVDVEVGVFVDEGVDSGGTMGGSTFGHPERTEMMINARNSLGTIVFIIAYSLTIMDIFVYQILIILPPNHVFVNSFIVRRCQRGSRA
jgi:hypothetical protein